MKFFSYSPDATLNAALRTELAAYAVEVELVPLRDDALPPATTPCPVVLIEWDVAQGWRIPHPTLEQLRALRARCVAVVDAASEFEACRQLAGSGTFVLDRAYPWRLAFLLPASSQASASAPTSPAGQEPRSVAETLADTPLTLDDFMHSVLDAIVIMDEAQHIRYWNTIAEQLYGWSASEVLGKHARDVLQTHFLGMSREAVLDELLREGQWSGYVQQRHREGQWIVLEAHSRVLRHGDGGMYGVLATMRDMTSHIDAVSRLAEREQQSLMFLEHFHGLAYQSAGGDTLPTMCVGVVRDVCGYRAEDFLTGAVRWRDLIHPDDLTAVLEDWERLESGVVSRLINSYRIIDAHGQLRWIKDIGHRWENEADGSIVISGLALDITAEKEFQLRVEMSELLYRNLWEMEANALFMIERETGAIREVNQAAVELYGYSREEFLTMRNVDVSAEPDRTRMATHSEVREIPVRWHKRKDGTVFPVEIHATHFQWQGKDVHLAAISDINDRLVREERLYEAEQRYRMLFEQSPDGVVVFDGATWRPRECNAKAYEQLAYTQSEFLELRLHDLVVDAPEAVDAIVQIAQVQGTVDFEALFRTGDFRQRDMHVTLVSLVLSGRPVLYAIMRDITTRKLTQDNLRTLSRAVEQSPAAIVITDADGIIEYVNPRFTAVTGYEASEAIGQTPRLIKSGEVQRDVYQALWRTLAEGEEWRGELLNRKKSGELYWALVSISPVKNEHGLTQHFVAVQEDITQTKKAQAELVDALERAERSDKLKDAFIANMSHEIRTPLNIILGFTALLRDSATGDHSDEFDLCIESIERGGERLLRTVEEILHISSIQAGTFPNQPIRMSIDEHTAHAVRDFSMRAEDKGLALDFEAGCAQEYILADPYVFSQMLTNLLDNAIKFTIHGGIRLRTILGDGEVLLTVADTGVGIDDEYLPHLFDSFTQEQTGNSRPFEGLGLGMALTKRYTEMCNASIEVASVKGVGTTFTVRFPLDSSR